MLSDILTSREAAAWFTGAAFAKAMTYRAEGRVMGLTVSADLTSISANVRGTGRQVYNVDITLEIDSQGVDTIDGQCSCPMGHNCKHVAATLLEVLAREKLTKKPIQPVPSAAGGSAASAILSAATIGWLEELGQAMRGDDYPPDVAQRLLYIVRPMAAGQQMPQLVVSLLSARSLKDGGFSTNAAKTRPSSFIPNAVPKFYRDVDIDILTGLSRQRNAPGLYDADPVRSVDLLQRIVATGRAFWMDYGRSPLAWGEVRGGRVEWRLAGVGGVTPHLLVDGATALNAEPPVYVDEAAGLIGLVELGLPPRLAHRLLAAPAIRPAEVALVTSGLNAKIPGIRPDLLPAAPEPALKITEDPVPVLHLGLGRTVVYNYYGSHPSGTEPIPVASLSFLYGPIELGRAEKAGRIEAVHQGRLYDVTRRPAREKAAAKILKDHGFIPARAVQPFLETKHHNDVTLPATADWLRFLHIGAEALRERFFEIRIGDDFPYRLAQSSGVFDAEFESSGIDWFELGLGIDVDGERYDLAPALAAFVRGPAFDSEAVAGQAESDGHFYLSLPDGRVLALAAARFVPLLLALHAISLNGLSLDRDGKVRLSRAETLPLLDYESEHFAFKGADNLRRLASLLQDRDRAEPDLPPWFGAVLRPYQAEGVAWLDMLRESGLGGVLADDMGLGKTVQLLALFALEKARGAQTLPSLVVAPTSLMGNWLNEARRFAPELKVLLLHGADRKQVFDTIADHDIVLTTYPLIARDHATLLAQDWHMAVLDEAQTIKNPNAATTRWLAGIKANHRFCMTGTPMENHLGELWSVMSFVNPGFLGDKTAFARNWRTPIEKRGDAVRSKGLRQSVKPFMLRRTKGEVATELPEKIEIAETIVIEGKQRDLYDSIRLAMSEKVRAAIKERGLGKSHIIVLEALLKLRQACCDPRLLKLDDKVDRPSAKLERLMEMVTELLSEGRKIIVFSQFTSMLALIEARFEAAQIRYSLLTGQTKDRAQAIDHFQSGASDVFLISLKAGGVGLNLTAADTVIIFDPWWNPAVEAQAIDRAHRLGQDKAVFVYRLVAAGTIEEKMDELKARKQALADSLFERDGEIGSALTEADVAALFEG